MRTVYLIIYIMRMIRYAQLKYEDETSNLMTFAIYSSLFLAICFLKDIRYTNLKN